MTLILKDPPILTKSGNFLKNLYERDFIATLGLLSHDILYIIYDSNKAHIKQKKSL